MNRFKDKNASIISTADLKTTKGKVAYWTIFFFLIVISSCAIVPTLWVVLTGFKSVQEIYGEFSFLPKNISWNSAKERVTEALTVMKYTRTLFNTLIVAGGSIVATLLSCGLGGYVISRLKPRGAKLMFMLIVWTMMLPAQIRTVPLFISYLNFPFIAELPGEVSLINTYRPIWLGCAAGCFNVILFKNHFDSISTSLVFASFKAS